MEQPIEQKQEYTVQFIYGKKPPKILQDILESGYKETYTVSIKGGREITYAKQMIGYVDKHEKVSRGRKMMLSLSKMPPKDTLDETFGIHEINLVVGKEKNIVTGTYGVCDGKKFFIQNTGHKPKSRSKGRS